MPSLFTISACAARVTVFDSGRQVSPSFSASRGVREGSVLSPTLFLVVMNPILLELSKRSCGPSVCGLYLGASSHADGIRILSTNISTDGACQ